MGVRRAMEIVMAETNKKEGPLFTFGPLIHNQQVLDLLETKGVKATDDLNALKTGRIVIRGPRYSSRATPGARKDRPQGYRCHMPKSDPGTGNYPTSYE